MTKIFGNWKEVMDGAWRKMIPSKKSAQTETPELPESLEDLKIKAGLAIEPAPEAKVKSPVNWAEFEAKLAEATAKLERMEREYSLSLEAAAARMTPAPVTNPLLEQFNSLKGDAQSAFFQKHSKDLLKAINTPDPKTTLI